MVADSESSKALDRRDVVEKGGLGRTCQLPCSAEPLIGQHEATGASGTIALAAVQDTASYGVVPTKDDGEVEAFLEKQPGRRRA